MRRRLVILLVLAALAAGGTYFYLHRPPPALVLTGIVTTDDVVVSPQIAGQIAQLLVKEGESVKKDQLVAVINPEELQADTAYYSHNVAGLSSQVAESEAALRLQERQTTDSIAQAEATLASTQSQEAAAKAELENATTLYQRNQKLAKEGVSTPEQLDSSRTAFEVAKSKLAAVGKQIEAAQAAVALAKGSAEQIAMRRSQVIANRQQQAAAAAQRAKADVRLAYTEIKAPIDGIIDVRAALPGEVVTPGQAVVTIINPDDLWIRVDIEETYIDRVREGDMLTVRLPSGAERMGKVFYRGVDAGFATQRDVSRTKRDIKTFEVRLRVDNSDRRLAVGMTAYVVLPLTS